MGFKPETMTNKILPALGYNGPSDQKSINAFLAASPAAAAKMGKYTMAARQMVEGKPINAANGMNVKKASGIVKGIVNRAANPNPIQRFNSLPQSQKTAAAHQQAIRDFSRSIGSQRGSSSSSGGGSRPISPDGSARPTPVLSLIHI